MTTLNPSTKRGTLTIAGSGISSVGHITLETLSHIKEAEKVFYAVCDPVTAAFIEENTLKGTTFDLTVFYDKNKNRVDSYIQMSEVRVHFSVTRLTDTTYNYIRHPEGHVTRSTIGT